MPKVSPFVEAIFGLIMAVRDHICPKCRLELSAISKRECTCTDMRLALAAVLDECGDDEPEPDWLGHAAKAAFRCRKEAR